MASCWIDGRLVPKDYAVVSVFDHGLLYGDGVFEGIRFYNRVPFRLQTHLQRLAESAAAICLVMPYLMADLRHAVAAVIEESGLGDGYIRLLVSRGVGSLGISPDSCSRATVVVIADQFSPLDENIRTRGATLQTVASRRVPPQCWDTRIKSLNYLNNVLAAIQARSQGADEAILLNMQGRVAEGATDNIFIVKNGALLTPPLHDGALAGITRAAVMELAVSLGVDVSERSLSPFDLYTADECFLTGTAVELVPVRSVDARPVRQCPGPLFKKLHEAFARLVRQESLPVHHTVAAGQVL